MCVEIHTSEKTKHMKMNFQIAHLIKSTDKLNYYGSIPSVTKDLNKWEGRGFVLIASAKCNQEMLAAEPSIHWS